MAQSSAEREIGHNRARAALLHAAGISFERQARALARTFAKLEELQEATKTEIVAYQGDYQTVEVKDNQTQARASEAIIDLLGVKPSKQSGDAEADVTIVIQFPSACQPTSAIDVTPQPVVVEAPRQVGLEVSAQNHSESSE